MEQGRREKQHSLKARQGFSLVELIIAVAILGIVTVPLMTVFVRSAQLNAKSRMIQKATDLGQNLMEGIREYTMQEIVEQCLSVNGDEPDFKILYSANKGYKTDKYTKLSAGAGRADFEKLIQNNLGDTDDKIDIYGDTEAFVGIGGDVYRFAFGGIDYNETYFDALIEFNKYIGSGDVNKNDGSVTGPVDSEDMDENTSVSGDYFLYTVTITVYSAGRGERFSDESRLTQITGAVQNRR